MRRLGSVQQKMPCVFLTEVRDEPSRKRDCQFQVLATENLNPAALRSDIHRATATEKVDGTCCFITAYQGEAHLWARLDRKPTKQAEKRFKQYQYSHRTTKGFVWNVEEDFRDVPEPWMAAQRVEREDGRPLPDEHGHIPGWVPVDPGNKQYCWHASVVEWACGVVLVVRPQEEDEGLLEVVRVPLAHLTGQTLELIGTNVNGNPYGLGSKKHPLHVLVPHGILAITNPPPVEFQQLCSWFQESQEGRVEGIVWHCSDGTLMKIHRHHLGLKWPIADTFLNSRPVVIRVGRAESESDPDASANSLFRSFSSFDGRFFSCMRDIQFTA